jgi:hypothetical protein
MIEGNIEQVRSLEISEELGFARRETESVSSTVFEREGMVYKLNTRNSLIRQQSDLTALQRRLSEFADHIPSSKVMPARYGNVRGACVMQPLIRGREIKNTERGAVEGLLRSNVARNKEFVAELLNYFLSSVENRQLYPDIVGYPEDPDFFNSINLMIEEETQRIMLCDVGLSPHENTISRLGGDFYQSLNVKRYTESMRRFKAQLSAL